jgi:hypothetical protein
MHDEAPAAPVPGFALERVPKLDTGLVIRLMHTLGSTSLAICPRRRFLLEPDYHRLDLGDHDIGRGVLNHVADTGEHDQP